MFKVTTSHDWEVSTYRQVPCNLQIPPVDAFPCSTTEASTLLSDSIIKVVCFPPSIYPCVGGCPSQSGDVCTEPGNFLQL